MKYLVIVLALIFQSHLAFSKNGFFSRTKMTEIENGARVVTKYSRIELTDVDRIHRELRKDGQLCEAEFNSEIRAEFSFEQDENESTLILEGDIKEGEFKKGELDFDATLKLQEDFTYRKDKVIVNFEEDAKFQVTVEENELEELTVDDIDVVVTITLDGQILILEGEIDGNIDNKYRIDFDGKLKVQESFDYQGKAYKRGKRVYIKVKNGEITKLK